MSNFIGHLSPQLCFIMLHLNALDYVSLDFTLARSFSNTCNFSTCILPAWESKTGNTLKLGYVSEATISSEGKIKEMKLHSQSFQHCLDTN